LCIIAWFYEYNIKDHLGNVRVSFKSNSGVLQQVESTNYDPFGIELNGTGTTNSVENRFKYQDKESLTLFGLSGINDFGARYYDKTIGRWWGVDALADMMPDWSPYNYVFNNPVQFIDPFGLSPTTGADGLTNDQWQQTSNPANHGSEAFGGSGLTTQYRQDNWHNEVQGSRNKANQRSFDELNDGESFSGENYSTIFTYGGFEDDIDNIYPYFYLRKKNRGVGEPGFGESLIPVWGSGRSAINAFQQGNYGWGAFHTAMAISDVFFVKTLATAAMKGIVGVAAKTGWKVGEPITNLTAKGNVPAWSTVRQRFWKNEAFLNGSTYSESNLLRMQKGLAPQRLNPNTGLMESMELHHHIVPQRNGGLFDFMKVWPDEHRALDPFRR
jgi:RHS repeat-associated protein